MPLLIVLLGYLIGSIPTAYIAGKLKTGQDIRRLGDCNMGAGNAYRKLGHATGIAVYFADVAKGALAVLIARWFNVSQPYIFITGAATVAGHNWPVFLGFRGGRGVSTTIGVLYILNPITMLIITLPTVLTLILFKNVILTSAFLFVLLPLLSWAFHVPGIIISYGIVLPCVIGFTHFLRIRKQPAADSKQSTP